MSREQIMHRVPVHTLEIEVPDLEQEPARRSPWMVAGGVLAVVDVVLLVVGLVVL